VDLEQVDVVGLEPGERRLDLIEDGLARKPGLVHVVTLVCQTGNRRRECGRIIGDKEVALGQERQPVTRDVVLQTTLSDASLNVHQSGAPS
jgi:hypothetical protein